MIIEIEDGRIISMEDGHQPHFFAGLDASKPTNPSTGDKYSAYDTGKEYSCIVENVWTVFSSPCVDEYSNHLGTVDSMMSTTVTGNSTASTTAHQMNLSSGLSAIGKAIYQAGIVITPDTEDVLLNMTVQNIIDGAGGARTTKLGAFEDPSVIISGIFFFQDTDDTWSVNTALGPFSLETTAIAAVVAGDLLTIYAKQKKVLFFVNGDLVATHSIDNTGVTWIPAAVVSATAANVTTARELSIDNISWRIYK